MPDEPIAPPEDSYDLDARDDGDAALLGGDNSVAPWDFAGLLSTALTHASLPSRVDAASAAHPWIARGPRNVGGRIRTILQDPINQRRFYAGSAFGGLWRTENSGETWNPLPLTTGQPEAGLPIGAIGICPRDSQHIYVGTGEPGHDKFSGNGIYHSTDGGTSFAPIAGTTGPGGSLRYERILVDPWNPERCWVACPDGLFRGQGGSPYTFVRDDITGAAAAPAGFQDITDVAIDFGNTALAARPAARRYTVYVAMRVGRANYTPGDANFGNLVSGGVFRAEFNPNDNTYTAWTHLNHAALPFPVTPGGVNLTSTTPSTVRWANGRLRRVQRTKLALSPSQPNTLYMVAGLADKSASAVFRTDDRGLSWRATATRPDDDGKQANYDLFVAVHPDDPDICITGSVEAWRTVNGGAAWTQIIHKKKFREGDRAQHADQHDLIFDRRDPRRIWLANDHGISESRNLGGDWRTRSFGIQATQLYDLTTHPQFPWIMAGGFQDNGSWITYGGTSWQVCGIADGGAVGFTPRQTDVFLTSTQGSAVQTRVELRHEASLRTTAFGPANSVNGVWRVISSNRLPDQPTIEVDGETRYPFTVYDGDALPGPFRGARAIFGHKLVAHPVNVDQFLLGERGDVYAATGGSLATDPTTLSWAAQDDSTAPGTVNFTAAVTAVCYAPTLPAVAPSPNSDNIWWIGTEAGQVYFTPDGGNRWHQVTARIVTGIGGATTMISDIQVHPRNTNIVIITHGHNANTVSISANAMSLSAGASNSTWTSISHSSTTRTGGAGTPFRRLPNCPVTRAVFDGDRAINSGSADNLTVYISTLSGVYVSRNVKADGSSPPDWDTFNTGLPLVLLRDLEYVESHNADATVRRRMLRAGTYGRGVYECDLGATGTPAARLLIRSTIVEDGHAYIPTETIDYDPRLNVPGQPAQPLDLTRSIDIRIDPPPYDVFGDVLDSVEFDEDLRSGTLVLGETNFVYVQVHTSGHAVLSDVDVHLYYADAPGAPPIAPNLNADFWDNFPEEQADGEVWQRAGTTRMSELHSGQPRVFRLPFTPPTSLGANVALLAVATHADDSLEGLAAADQPTRSVHPHAAILPNAITVAERRAALYITPTSTLAPNVFIRDGQDDTGEIGAVAWGGRGADIIVTQAPVADPDVAFDDITALRPDDRIRAGSPNIIYVRAFNGSNSVQTIQVDVYAVPLATLADASTWSQVGTRRQLVDLQPKTRRITFPITWNAADIADPAPTGTHKAFILIALIGSAEDAMPDHTGIRTLEVFWAMFRSAENANNACFRAVAYEPVTPPSG